jgi:hypothetical protein
MAHDVERSSAGFSAANIRYLPRGVRPTGTLHLFADAAAARDVPL